MEYLKISQPSGNFGKYSRKINLKRKKRRRRKMDKRKGRNDGFITHQFNSLIKISNCLKTKLINNIKHKWSSGLRQWI
jgi:predicted glycosyl hydrolase (DUF1957 family)